jgi:fluoride exporter
VTVLLVGLAGAFGTMARYLLDAFISARFASAFPLGTFAVNTIGSFVLGVIVPFAVSGALSPTARLMLTTGAMGGFTTYSAFNNQSLLLFEQGALGLGAAYVAGTVAACLAAGALGLLAGRLLAGV